MTKTATRKRKDTGIFWCHLLFQKVKILSIFQSKIAVDNSFLWKICLPFLSPEDLAQKLSFCILHYLRLLWCSVTKREVGKRYSRLLLPKKTAQQMQKGVLGLLLVTECFGGSGPSSLYWGNPSWASPFHQHPLSANRREHVGQLGIPSPTRHPRWTSRATETAVWYAMFQHLVHIHPEGAVSQKSA